MQQFWKWVKATDLMLPSWFCLYFTCLFRVFKLRMSLRLLSFFLLVKMVDATPPLKGVLIIKPYVNHSFISFSTASLSSEFMFEFNFNGRGKMQFQWLGIPVRYSFFKIYFGAHYHFNNAWVICQCTPPFFMFCDLSCYKNVPPFVIRIEWLS